MTLALRIGRIVLAIAAGAVVAVALIAVLSAVARLLGIPTWIDFGQAETFMFGGGIYTTERKIDSAFTIAGTTIIIAGIMLGVRAGMAVHAGRLDGGMRPERQLLFTAWFYGIVLYGIIGAVLFAVFDRRPGFEAAAHRLLQLAAVILCYKLGERWLHRRRRALDPPHPDARGR